MRQPGATSPSRRLTAFGGLHKRDRGLLRRKIRDVKVAHKGEAEHKHAQLCRPLREMHHDLATTLEGPYEVI